MEKNKKTLGSQPHVQIKTEPGNAVAKTERLTSFKVPRDLTLGGGRTMKASTNKKVYTPNLNVVRTKALDVQTSRDTTARGRGAKTRGGRGAKTDKRGASNVVQTSGVFSEGIAGGVIRRAASAGGGGYGSSREGANEILRKPALIKRDLIKLDPDVEMQQIRDILGDDEDGSLDDRSAESDNMPIKLIDPTKPKIKLELKTKIEPLVNGVLKNEMNGMEVEEKQLPSPSDPDFKLDSKHFDDYPTTMNEFFNRQQLQMVLLQLPDSLPGRGPEKDIAPPPKPSSSAVKTEEIVDAPESTKTPLNDSNCCMNHLQEGQIGKLLRYKSGKTKLILGDTHYDVELGMEAGFLQDLMSIDTNREQRNGDMIKLGEINAKLNATPDWEHLFSKATT